MTFRPEFINRLDETIVFHPLRQEDVRKIAYHSGGEACRNAWRSRGSICTWRTAQLKLLAEKGYDPAFGARPLKRTIQSMLQNAAG